MADEDNLTHMLHDKLCQQNIIRADWMNGKTISVVPFSMSPAKNVTSTNPNKLDVNIHCLETIFFFDEPVLRTLVAEATGIFLNVQHLQKNGVQKEYLKASRSYRSAIRACLEKVQMQRIDPENATEKTRCDNYIDYLYTIECIWHICEILLIDIHPSNVVVPQLLEWVRFHFPEAECEAAKMFATSTRSDDFWSVIKKLMLQGQVDVVRALLRLDPAFESIPYQMADTILKSMPVYNIYSGISLQKYKSQWQYWFSDVECKIKSGIFDGQPRLEEILRLTIGDQQAWKKQLAESVCWYEFFPGYLFYTQPSCKYFELGAITNKWYDQWTAGRQSKNEMGSFKIIECVIMSVMSNDINQVIRDLQNLYDNKWFVTHLTDLLQKAGQLQIFEEHKRDVSIQLRDAFVFEFGAALMAHESLWQIGLDYLDSSSDTSKTTIELLLSKVPITNERQAQKIIDVAQKKQLPSIEGSISKVLARRSLAHKRYGNALEWAIRSQDNIFVTGITDLFLKHYCKTGEMLCTNILSHIGAKMFISPRLVFLIKYFDFHQYYRRREFSQAAVLLINLLNSRITPEYFWPSLLADAIPLLESKDPKMPAKESEFILHYLESQFTDLINKVKQNPQHKDSQALLGDYRLENVLELEKLIRLSCARNIARCIIIENSAPPL